MSVAVSQSPARCGLEHYGLTNLGTTYWNLPTPRLYEEAVRRREGRTAHLGPPVVRTGLHTGRSPNHRFIVQEPASEEKIRWGQVNRPIEPAGVKAAGPVIG